ncbi:hypothetical protein I4U23_029587 [Adineta vaga]|nr:hypothetical protein I4U23_029587 [Adineta vaga]
MARSSAHITPMYFTCFLIVILLLQFTQPIQSLALSSLCGQFGHSCFGGNWGKRELSTASIATDVLRSNFDDLDGEMATTSEDEEMLIKNLLLEEIRLSLLRQRVRHLLKLE